MIVSYSYSYVATMNIKFCHVELFAYPAGYIYMVWLHVAIRIQTQMSRSHHEDMFTWVNHALRTVLFPVMQCNVTWRNQIIIGGC